VPGMNFQFTFGFAGVSTYENSAAKRWGRRFEWPMVLLAIWIPVAWYFEYLNVLPSRFLLFTDWAVWMTFVVETVLMTTLVWDKKRYLKGNWMNLVIIVAGFPLLWQTSPLAIGLRSLRLIVLYGVFVRLTRLSKKALQKNRLGSTLLVALIVIFLSGIAITMIDPAIHSPEEGIWWAWVTVTTVGYGDFVPVSTAGRIFGGFLILLGVGLFALLTANFSAALIGHEVTGVGKGVEKVEVEESTILDQLDRIEQRLTKIEEKLK